ncbi:MAG: LptF/LptG family permease, partial [Alphaproteobacteria bacterium]|nr:LptF/LptG family permease [Alphaproteobacteria bacterium]
PDLWSGPVVPRYAWSFFAGVALQVLIIMVLVEAIFLAERFPMVFRDVLKNNADLIDTALLFVCNSTQIFDLALALAILMAVYWTVLRMRENRELLVLFAAGTGPYQLMALTLVIAFTALIGSLAVSGVIDPASRYAQRVILFDAKFRALRGGINTGQFYYFHDRVAFAPAQSPTTRNGASPDQTQRLFVYEPVRPGRIRVITADHARLDGPDPSGMILLKLAGFTSHTFSSTATEPAVAKTCGGCRQQAKDTSRMTLSAPDVTQEMTLDELLTFLPRGSKAEEWTIFEQLASKKDAASPKYGEEMRLLGERFARSLLCLLAPLIALASVCLTSRATNYLVLPLACMALMSLNVTSEWLIRTIAPSSPLEALAVPAAFAAAIAALLLAEIVREQGRLVRPQLARP